MRDTAMTTADFIQKNVGTIILGVGFIFSMFHNVKNNSTKTDTNEKRLNTQEANTAQFIAVMDKMVDLVTTKEADRKRADEQISNAHKKREFGDEKNAAEIAALRNDWEVENKIMRKELVSHVYLDKEA